MDSTQAIIFRLVHFVSLREFMVKILSPQRVLL